MAYDEDLSRELSSLLRYKAEQRGLSVTFEGFIDVNDAARQLRRSVDQIMEVVAKSNREGQPRFETKTSGRGCSLIRATRKCKLQGNPPPPAGPPPPEGGWTEVHSRRETSGRHSQPAQPTQPLPPRAEGGYGGRGQDRRGPARGPQPEPDRISISSSGDGESEPPLPAPPLELLRAAPAVAGAGGAQQQAPRATAPSTAGPRQAPPSRSNFAAGDERDVIILKLREELDEKDRTIEERDQRIQELERELQKPVLAQEHSSHLPQCRLARRPQGAMAHRPRPGC